MWVADMDFRSPEPVIQAIQDRAAHGVFGYAGELPGLHQAVVDRMVQRYGWDVQPEHLVFMPGVVTGFNMAAHAFVGAGEGVLIQTPVYMPFLDVARNVGGLFQQAELARDSNGQYNVDWEKLEANITSDTRMFLLCNPHNPVGRVYTRVELERMAEICLRHNLIICADEIHSDLVFPGYNHIPMALLSPEIEQKTVTLIAPSKTFNIAGLACSVAVIPNTELRKKFSHGGLGLVHGVNVLGLIAAKAAYLEGQEWLDQLMDYLLSNRDYLYEYVNSELPGVHMGKPEGTYLAWLDCRESAANQSGFLCPCEFFIKKARVGMNDGAAFGKGGEGFVRLNFGCPRSMLVEALSRMRQALIAR
jgi:cystathionine beta-lyase